MKSWIFPSMGKPCLGNILTMRCRVSKKIRIPRRLWGHCSTGRCPFEALGGEAKHHIEVDTNSPDTPLTLHLLSHTDNSMVSGRQWATLNSPLEEEEVVKERTTHDDNDNLQALVTFIPPPHEVPLGGRIFYHLHHWQKITTDRWVLNLMQFGCTLKFLQIPPCTPP